MFTCAVNNTLSTGATGTINVQCQSTIWESPDNGHARCPAKALASRSTPTIRWCASDGD